MVEPFQEFDLPQEIDQLKRKGSWQSGRNAKTLLKRPDLRVVLTILKANALVHEHRVRGRVVVHTVSGHVRIHVGDRKFNLTAGHLLALEENLAHDVEALTDSAFLLTIVWPDVNNS